MAYNHQQFPFWDFVRQFDNSNGAGVDHQASGPSGPRPDATGDHQYPPQDFGFGGPFGWGRGGFGGGPWGGRGGHRGRHGGRPERRGSRGPSHEHGPEGERPDGEPSEEPGHGRRGGRRHGHHGRRDHSHSGSEHSESERGHSPHGRRGSRGCGRRERGGRGGRGFGGHPRGPPPFGGPGGFDMNGLMQALSNHPLAQAFRGYAEQAAEHGAGQQRSGTIVPEQDDGANFVPPIDVFSTEKAYVLHVALPGAKKEDVGVHWDEDKGVLNIAGVVYRQGDEEFLQTLAQSERKVGAFERVVKLPPGVEEKEEVDGDMITAKLEDGVLVVTVPKAEKEWTEVKKVDIM